MTRSSCTSQQDMRSPWFGCTLLVEREPDNSGALCKENLKWDDQIDDEIAQNDSSGEAI